MKYKLKHIEWKEYDNKFLGYVGGMKLFEYEYDMPKTVVGYMSQYKLKSRLFGEMTLTTAESCQDMAQARLQQFVAKLVE
jgi:hypothetical protein